MRPDIIAKRRSTTMQEIMKLPAITHTQRMAIITTPRITPLRPLNSTWNTTATRRRLPGHSVFQIVLQRQTIWPRNSGDGVNRSWRENCIQPPKPAVLARPQNCAP
jgi:hypothetical protein